MIKLVLLVGVALVAVAALRLGTSPRHLALRRLAVALLVAVAGSAVVFPDVVTSVANTLGVGRGADLVLYGLVVVSTLAWLRLQQQLRRLEAQMTRVVRFYALAEARSTAAAEREDLPA